MASSVTKMVTMPSTDPGLVLGHIEAAQAAGVGVTCLKVNNFVNLKCYKILLEYWSAFD